MRLADALIGATAIVNTATLITATLITANVKHFGVIQGLDFETFEP